MWSYSMMSSRASGQNRPGTVRLRPQTERGSSLNAGQRRTSTFERGCVDDVAYVRNLKTMHETPPDVGQASTNRRMRLLSCDFGQSFRECCFHSDPRIESEGVVDQGRGDFLHTKSHDVDMGAEIDERDFRLLAVGDVGYGVERDRIPDDFGFRLRVIVRKQETAGGVSAVHFKSLVGGVRRRKAQVVEQRRDV